MRGSTSKFRHIDAKQALEEPFGSFLRPGCGTEHFPQPHPHGAGELKDGSYAPGLPDHEIGSVPAPRLIATQTRLNRGASAQRIGEDDGVLERLASALPEIGGRSVNGVAQQGHAPYAPNAPRRVVKNIVSQDGVFFGRLDKGSERDAPVFYALNRFTPVAERAGM